jgi:SnoaL-like domain
MELWELAAREHIRDTLARYNWSGDALRLDDLAQTFCEDGELELRGSDPVRGRAAIIELLGGAVAAPNATAQASGVKRIVRHNVTNIRFTEVRPDRHESPATSRSSPRLASTITAATEMSLCALVMTG